MKGLCVITHHFETAATGRSLRPKCTDDHVTTSLDCSNDLANVGETLLWRGKKVEYRSIMPEIVCMLFELDFDDITGQPTHLLCIGNHPFLRDLEGGFRSIEHG